MTCDTLRDTEADTTTLRTIGQGFCGTVWASETGPAFKREDGGPHRSLQNDFDMHQRILQSFQKIPTLQIHIPACDAFITAENQKWWSANRQKFPPGFQTPCNIIQSQRIPPLTESVRRLLIDTYCPPTMIMEIIASEPNKDCLIRPYLGRRRIRKTNTTSRFKAFSLRNFPLHLDQLEELGITTSDIHQYAKVMAETLAMMHWVGGIDGNDIEFVLARPNPSSQNPSSQNPSSHDDNSHYENESDALGGHSLWVLDFDLCRRMAMDSKGVEQAAAAFWRNDPYYPRPCKELERDMSLWLVFREHYLQTSETCIGIAACEPQEAERRRALSRLYISMIEQEGKRRKK